MVNFVELIALAGIAGFTIFLGLPVARMKSATPALKGLLNSAAAGILIFLLVDILGNAFQLVDSKMLGFLSHTFSLTAAMAYLILLVLGVSIGLLALVWFEKKYVKNQKADLKLKELTREEAERISLMIAVGIGFHNFSEGLAIGQSYASGAIAFALLLVAGFGLHNATEGFGVASPLSGSKPSWKFLGLLGLIGGGPAFIGAIVGSFWISGALSVFCLALAAGAIIYVVKELLYHGRIHGEGLKPMSFLILGFFLGFATDLLIKFAGG